MPSSSTRTSKRTSSSTNCSSAGSSESIIRAATAVNDKVVRSRKRQRKPSQWKQNKAKIKRNLGQAYKSISSEKEVLARKIKPPCSTKCRLKCFEKIGQSLREELFTKFWDLGDINLQRSFVSSCLVEVVSKYRYTNAENPRGFNHAFYFTLQNEKTRVCKTFFINTLDISDRMVRTVKRKKDSCGFVKQDLRGKHDNHKKVDERLVQEMVEHIDSIPRIESHYVRASTSREYIDGSKTIQDIYRDFERQQIEKNRPAGKYHKFYEIFNTRFNIGFHTPKKDQCDLCTQYENSNEVGKDRLRADYNTHIKEKELCREEKRVDRQKIDDKNLCVVYDMQAQMPSPNGDTSAFYYKSRLNSENFTVVELSYENVHCYFWDETNGKKGSTEIGSCLLQYLKDINEKTSEEKVNIIFYSDNCCGQNKNKYIATLYLYAVSTFRNIESITHKFLVQGHTQNEGDNVHSLIEKEIKKNLKSGPIYTPQQYIPLIKCAKKSGKPFIIHELGFDFFKDLKHLQENWGYNYNENDKREPVIWNDIKIFRFCKGEPFTVFYKTSYAEDNFQTINVRNKRKKNMPDITSITLKQAYDDQLALSDNKKKALKYLLSRDLIPQFYESFYKDLVG
nr:unnamed protein product [Callosobruchus chinensis]